MDAARAGKVRYWMVDQRTCALAQNTNPDDPAVYGVHDAVRERKNVGEQ